MIEPVALSKLVFRGPRPETTSDFNKLTGLGIHTILDLQGDPWEVLTHAANEREWMAYDTGKSTVRIAMNGFLPPTRDDVMLAIAALDRANDLERSTYVHCRYGVDRTGYVLAAWRMRRCGFTYDLAVSEMKGLGFHDWYWYWLPSLRKYELVPK
jgi:protein-tyrosine phosphatase